MPATCCRCNGSGRCKNCSCVKAKQPCTNCLLKRKGTCQNCHSSPTGNGAQHLELEHETNLRTLASPPGPPQPTVHAPQNLVRDATVTVPEPRPQPSEQPESNPPPSTLPPITSPMARPQFDWSEVDSESFVQAVTAAHSEVVHWRRNVFAVPSGKAGKAFVSELARLYRAYAEGSALELITLKATTILPILLLQKPHRSSKSREHVSCLERRLTIWKTGHIDALLQEGRTIQGRLPKPGSTRIDEDHTARVFSKLMLQGKTKAALRLISVWTAPFLPAVQMQSPKQCVRY